MTATPPKPTPICQCGCQHKQADSEAIAKLEAKVHRHSAAIEQALAEIRKILDASHRDERVAA